MFFTGLFAATSRPVRRRADSVVRARVTGPYLAIVQHVYGLPASSFHWPGLQVKVTPKA